MQGSSADIVIERASTADLEALHRLLEEHHLPTAGLRDHLAHALVARERGVIVGSAALEIYRDGALLRSVAVRQRLQRTGLGGRLTRAALDLASERRVHAVYLLTTTAERYFPKFGFERITREDVPDGVKTSVEFTAACPSTAVVMRRILANS